MYLSEYEILKLMKKILYKTINRQQFEIPPRSRCIQIYVKEKKEF